MLSAHILCRTGVAKTMLSCQMIVSLCVNQVEAFHKTINGIYIFLILQPALFSQEFVEIRFLLVTRYNAAGKNHSVIRNTAQVLTSIWWCFPHVKQAAEPRKQVRNLQGHSQSSGESGWWHLSPLKTDVWRGCEAGVFFSWKLPDRFYLWSTFGKLPNVCLLLGCWSFLC